MRPEITEIDFDKCGGLVPAIVQDVASSRILMLAYMNKDAYQLTLERNLATFYSRSKKQIWQKGESSGNTLKIIDISLDCDQDTLLLKVEPTGPACHKGTSSCFDRPQTHKVMTKEQNTSSLSFLEDLENVIKQRRVSSTSKSYTKSLFNSGIEAIAQKVGEEAVEVVIAALSQSQDDFRQEAADLVFHLLVLLESKNCSLSEVVDILDTRHQSQ